jgi:hypothetical protein
MIFPRATLIFLPCPVAVALCASLLGVQASPCLSSASAVKQEYPGAWPSWTMRAPGHEGEKCWYPTTRTTTHDHRGDTAPNDDTIETRKLQSTPEGSTGRGSSVAETDGFDRHLPNSATQIDATPTPESSFADRFAAAIRSDSAGLSRIMRFMIDPIGSWP